MLEAKEYFFNRKLKLQIGKRKPEATNRKTNDSQKLQIEERKIEATNQETKVRNNKL